ncbi:MAG: hypothetical protein ACOX52_17720 [Verrucomicrobiota bacterium]
MHTSMMVAQDYWYTGNLELLEAYYDRLKAKTLIELAARGRPDQRPK